MYTFHLLSLPHALVNKDYCSCAFTQKILNMYKMMKGAWYNVILYGTEWWEVDVETFSKEDFNRIYPKDHKGSLYDSTNPEWRKIYCDNTIRAIEERKTWRDILLLSYWYAHKPIKDATKLPWIEMGIGYPSSMNDCHRVFESYAWMNNHYWQEKVVHPNNYDTVIPNYFDISDFEFNENPKDYFLFVGRPSTDKGRWIAVDVAIRSWIKLKLAWQAGDVVNNHLNDLKSKWFDVSNIEHVWWINVEQRKELMKNAKALFVPTQYIEPFAGVQIEALLCGTPLITSDFGVFNETNKHWITGYRCRHFNDYMQAVQNINEINRQDCRNRWELYSLDNIWNYYDYYFKKVIDLLEWWGFYSEHVTGLKYNVLDF